jgi:integrase
VHVGHVRQSNFLATARRELGQITKASGLGEQWTPRELRHSFVSILSASDAPLEDISQFVGHVSTSVTETVYRHEIRPVLTKGAAAMDKIFKVAPASAEAEWLPSWFPKIKRGP